MSLAAIGSGASAGATSQEAAMAFPAADAVSLRGCNSSVVARQNRGKMSALRASAAGLMVLGLLAAGPSTPTLAQAQKPAQTPNSAEAPTRTQKAFDSWIVTCLEAKGNKRCALSQSRVIAKSRQVLFAWSIARNPDGGLVSVLTTPTGVSVQEGVRMVIGGGEPLRVAYNTCGPRACQARLSLDAAMLDRMRNNQKISVNFVQANKRLVQTEIDLKGFTAAYAYFDEQMK